jgi:putative cell wall-binding protein
LLVSKYNIPDSVREEISRINPGKVYIIGLKGVVSQGLEDEIAAVISLNKSDIVRIGGQDRYATSLEVAKYFSMKGSIICAATGSNFPDALAGSVYAALYDAPVILADSSLPEDVVTYLKSRNTSGTVIFGGEGAVSSDIENQLVQILK